MPCPSNYSAAPSGDLCNAMERIRAGTGWESIRSVRTSDNVLPDCSSFPRGSSSLPGTSRPGRTDLVSSAPRSADARPLNPRLLNPRLLNPLPLNRGSGANRGSRANHGNGSFEDRAGCDRAWPLGTSNVVETSEDEASTSDGLTEAASLAEATGGRAAGGRAAGGRAAGGRATVCRDAAHEGSFYRYPVGRLPPGVLASCGILTSVGAGSVPRRSEVASSWPRFFAVCVHASGAWSRQLVREQRLGQ
jgi:hypothetical protein